MPTNVTPVEEWTTIQKPVGTDVANRTSAGIAIQPTANRIELLKNRALGGVTTWPIVGIRRIASLAAAQPDNTGGTGWFLIRPYWVTATYALQYLICPANDIVNTGEIITSIDSMLKPGFARNGAGGTGDRVFVDLCYAAHDWLDPTLEPVTPTVLASTHDDGTNTKQRVTSSSFTHTVDVSRNDYFFRVRGGSDSDTHPDQLYALSVLVTKPSLVVPPT